MSKKKRRRRYSRKYQRGFNTSKFTNLLQDFQPIIARRSYEPVHRSFPQSRRRTLSKIRLLRNLLKTNTVPSKTNRKHAKSILQRARVNAVQALKNRVCPRRKQRRQSLFAKQKVGKGVTVNKRRVYTYRSLVKC